MNTFNFHGEISGPSNFGDGGRIEIHHGESPTEALSLATELVRQLRTEGLSTLAAQAETVRGELVEAEEEQRPADHGRIRQALQTISLGLTAGSSGLVLVQELGHLIGH
ncbi:hypothetical protein [Streptomyces celluloflavus]|uniref:Uncharacterized protein n=1 Tax=Streptomyces celluloflavus TaxID=58344 RepID=A0ABW7RJV7_9ACTN|nr:hypothetical protein OG717_32005 [Streptomyces celluloflavus]